MDDSRATTPSISDLPRALRLGAFALPAAVAGAALFGAAVPPAWGLAPWLVALFAGALAGGAIASRAAALLLDAREGPSRPAAPEILAAPALQVVAGAARPAVSEAVAALASAALRRHERTLVIEGKAGLALHRELGGAPRRGLVECLSESAPVSGLVQETARAGLGLLSYGLEECVPDWSRLGRVLAAARPQFDRLILAFANEGPAGLRRSLDGAAVDARWAGGPATEPLRRAFEERTGILLVPSELRAPVEMLPEAPLEPAARPGSAAREVVRHDGAGATRASEPVVLDCDLRVRERLRFLLWTRRVREELRSASAVEVSTTR
jgi:hypothetical protein